jgi:hypothetical protein
MSLSFICPVCSESNSVGPEFAGRRGTCAFCSAAVIVPQVSGQALLAEQLPESGPRKSSFPWIAILAICCAVFLVCGGVLLALLLPAINAAREAGRRASCMNKMHQIGLALQNYAVTKGGFPGSFPPAAGSDAAGNPPMSWRIAILPYMQQDALYRQYDPSQPWNSPKNVALVKQMPGEFRCPSDSDDSDGETSYFMITGKNMVGGPPGSPGTRFSDITDGLSGTIAIVEVHGLKIPWTEPRDITLNELLARLHSGGRIAHVATFNVGMADQSVRNLPANIDAETLRRLATINDGLPVEIKPGSD